MLYIYTHDLSGNKMQYFIRQQPLQNMHPIRICSNHFFVTVQLLSLALIFMLAIHFSLRNR